MNHSIRSIHALMMMTVILLSCSSIRNPTSTRMEFRANDMEADKVGNYYLIDSRGEIRKYTPDNELQYSFKNYNSGTVASVDVTNPHKIMVFFRDFQTLMLLDNTLSEIKTIKLDDSGYYTAAGTSNDGNIWLYNSVRNTINKISYDGAVSLESIPLRRFAPYNITDAKIIERENLLFINDANHGVLLYNNLGIFTRIIPLTGASKLQIDNNSIYYLDKASYQFSAYDLSLNKEIVIFDLKDHEPSMALASRNYILLIKKNALEILLFEDGREINN